MIADNVVFWQGIVFALWGYLVSLFLNVLIGYPRRFIESA